MNEIKKITLTNTEDSHNKIWIGQLFDNQDVTTFWGRIGTELQSKTFKGVGEKFLITKYNQKIKKGYIESE